MDAAEARKALDVFREVDDETRNDNWYVVPFVPLILEVFIKKEVLYVLKLQGRKDLLLRLPFMHS